MSVASLVRTRRLTMGLTLDQVAQATGLSRQTLYLVESGRTAKGGMTLSTAVRLCDALVIDPHQLINEARHDACA